MRLTIHRGEDQADGVQAVRIDHEGTSELVLAVHPKANAGGFEAQAQAAYDRLFEALCSAGFGPEHLVTERLFFSRIERQFDALEAVRARVYRDLGVSAEGRPAATFLQQPPCEPGRSLELQATALMGSDTTPVTREPVPGLPGLASGKVVAYRGHRHVYLSNITGAGERDVPFGDQVKRMFERGDACLNRAGATFKDVVRTWIYLTDIAQDYATFNPVRTGFYKQKGLVRIPASTGIQGGTYPPHAACTMDVYALLPAEGVSITPMHAPTMNEATAYGSTFSRGMLLRDAGRATAFVSGTASIDEGGCVVHLGDVAAQTRRALDNVEALLGASGAGLEDLVSVTVYLKSPDHLEAFRSVWCDRGLPQGLPHTVTVADVCRPDWLCEIEAVAVYPGGASCA